jgi:acetoin utilization deacetylase AcuC-like enzyme
MAQQFCEGKVAFLLEGGYDLDALRSGVSNVARLLLGEPPTDPLGLPSDTRPDPGIGSLVAQLQHLHRL